MSPSPENGAARRTAARKRRAAPKYDAASVGRVARRVEILTVELIGSSFARADSEPLPISAPSEEVPELSASVTYSINDDQSALGCITAFSTSFKAGAAPYELKATFRIVYSVTPGEAPLTEPDLWMFAHYNAVYNAWPYWREYLSSTINRAQLPRFILPVFRVPRSQ